MHYEEELKVTKTVYTLSKYVENLQKTLNTQKIYKSFEYGHTILNMCINDGIKIRDEIEKMKKHILYLKTKLELL